MFQVPTDYKLNQFTRHNDSVLCCAVDNSSRLAVTGGIDETAIVWDLNTKHVIFECLGHKESVVAVSFSSNSSYVATGDLSGYIQVRNTTTGIKIFDSEIDEINWIQWHNTSEYVLLAGTTKGDFWMWNVNDPAAVKTFASYGSSSTNARLLSDGMKAVVSYQDGSVRLFDLKTRQSILHYQDPNHSEVISMDLCTNKSILAIGCLDSSVKLLTIGNMKSIGTLNCKTPDSLKNRSTTFTSNDEAQGASDEPMEDGDVVEDDGDNEDDASNQIKSEPIEVIDNYSNTDTGDNDAIEDEDCEDDIEGEEVASDDSDSVESVLFSPCGNFIAAANNSGTIIIWDVSSQVVRSEKHTGIGVTRASWTSNGNYITAHLDGCLRVYDNNLTEKVKIVAHKDQILDLTVRHNVLVTVSEDKTARIINMENKF